MTDIEMNNTEMAQNSTPKANSETNHIKDNYIDYIDLGYIFGQIKSIQDQTTYLNEVIDKLSQMTDGDSGDCGAPGNIMGKAKAEALGDIVRCRETTNQQLLNFYARVYNDMISGTLSPSP